MRNRNAALTTILLVGLAGLVPSANASILTFDITDTSKYDVSENFPEGFAVPQEYGDRVDSLSTVAGTVTYGYGEDGEGFTPNVTVGYGPFSIFTGGPSLWRYDFGDLDRVVYQGSIFTGSGTDYNYLEITFFADPGYDVILYGFDVAGWQADFTINSVSVYNWQFNGFFPELNRVFHDPDVTILGASQTEHNPYSFGTPIRANVVTILIDANNIGADSQFIGIDNIRFGQALDPDPNSPEIEFPPNQVPEPGTVSMLAAGLAALAIRARKRRY